MLKLAKKLKIKTFYHDVYVRQINHITKLNSKNHLSLLKKFSKILVLVNYGDFEFNKALKNINVINIWN